MVIIDGVEASINSINPQDIEAMSVLKDAASSAIYGSRAANGVILITTKQGKAGSLKLDYNGYVSFQSTNIPNSMHPVSNYADYMELINEGLSNSGLQPVFHKAKSMNGVMLAIQTRCATRTQTGLTKRSNLLRPITM